MYKPNERDKEIFRQRIIKGAQLFDKYLLHKEFIIITIDFEIYKVTFKKKEFLHLTGLTVNLVKIYFTTFVKGSQNFKKQHKQFSKA